MNIVVYAAVFGAFVGIGYYIWRGYKQRKVYFENLLSFCNHLMVEIRFSKNTTLNIIDNYAAGYAPQFRQTLTNYKNLLTDKKDITHESIDAFLWKKLKPAERAAVGDFFYELGRHGSTEEAEKIQNKKVTFDTFFAQSAEGLRRDASIYLKIFILLGIGAVVLIL